MKLTKILGNILALFVILPVILVVAIIFIPFILKAVVLSLVEKIRDKKKLRQLLQVNNGQIYFIYADYNNYDFSKVITEKHKDVICIKINKQMDLDLLTKHLIKDCKGKSYPRLVKVKNGDLVYKEHYDAFKYLHKRSHNIEAFLELIEKSIHNLKKK